MSNIGIVGAGVAGLHLGLYLRQQGIETTIYAEKTPGQEFGGRIPALVARFGHTRERERLLGINHWDGGNSEFSNLNVYVGGEQPMTFSGTVAKPFIAVDMRIYLGRLLEDFAARGGHVVTGAVQAGDLEQLSSNHDLLVVASGRAGLTNVFPRLAEYSPFDRPQRWICMGLFRGISAAPSGGSVTFVPEQGEIFEFPIYSFMPNLRGLGFEAVPGSAFEAATRLRYEDDPAAFNASLLGLLREHAPLLYERVDPATFGLTRPLDLLQGGVTPTVRHGYVRLNTGKYALALGDVQATNDPITGQGANKASYTAWMLGEAISKSDTFGEAFCEQIEQRIWAYTAPIVNWSNAMLQPPQPHMIEILVAAAQNQDVANAFVNFFEQPQQAWEIMGSQEQTTKFLAQYNWQGMPQMPVAA
jgi:hypothetical protein